MPKRLRKSRIGKSIPSKSSVVGSVLVVGVLALQSPNESLHCGLHGVYGFVVPTRTAISSRFRSESSLHSNAGRKRKLQVRFSNRSEDTTTAEAFDDRQMVDILGSYVENLQRARTNQGDTKALNSLAHYLSNNLFDGTIVSPIFLQVDFGETSIPSVVEEKRPSIQEVLERALIQGLRQAGESKDYRMILRLVSGCIAFANEHPILTPRIFGEAIHALSLTKANASKLKSVWNLLVAKGSSFLSSPPTAFELNIFLRAMASLGKSRACIDVYREYSNKNTTSLYIPPDAYTISILLSVLADSISQDQKMCEPVDFALSLPQTQPTLRTKMKALTSSTCWQWNAAVELFDGLPDDSNQRHYKPHIERIQWRNNHVYSALLKLQGKAQDLCTGQSASGRRHKNGPELTMSILDDMIQHDVIPDVVTCTLAIKAMGRASVSTHSVLPATKTSQSVHTSNLAVQFLQQMKSNPRLPKPNQYSYSAAITACARLKDHRAALELLEEMRNQTTAETSIPPPPNTWVYNTALLSLNNKEYCSSQQKQQQPGEMKRWRKKQIHKVWTQNNQDLNQQKRTTIALSLVDQMKNDERQHGLDTKPDTITYNTVLGIASFPHYMEERPDNINSKVELMTSTKISALTLIDEMRSEGIPRDAITYRNAIESSSDDNELIDILHLSLEDTIHPKSSHSTQIDSLTSVFNTALYTLTKEFSLFQDVLALMFEHKVEMDVDTVTALIYVVGRNGKGAALENLIQFLSGVETDDSTRQLLLESLGLDAHSNILNQMPPLEDSHYTEAIKNCLRDNDFGNAHNILSIMRSEGINPTTKCMEGFALAYAQSAMDGIERVKNQKKAANRDKHLSACIARASNAYKIAMALGRPRPSTLGRVGRACAITGQWNLCRALLRTIHTNVLKPGEDGGFFTISPRVLQTIRGTHSFLLRECAKQGNVHAALHYTSDIQEFSKKIRTRNQLDQREIPSPPKFAEVPSEEDDVFRNLRSITDSLSSNANAGMQPNDWISLIQAAAKSGHWKVCFNTLQFLRPYVERTNLAYLDSNSVGDEKYNQLAQALYVVTRSLESHSQYAWASRGIEDWIEWSGRQPRVESVLSAIRALASNGCVDEIRHMMACCLREDLQRSKTKSNNSMTYEEVLYVGTVTALHNNGLYDDADELFMKGIEDGYLPFQFVRENGQFVLDLHGLNVALAHSAVRIGMRQQAGTLAEEGSPFTDMMIITGKGRHSEFHLRPVLRPEVQRMLLEEFYPPLNTMSIPGNMGALAILAHDIEAWQEHQQQQKGVRMLKLAGLLRNLSSQERLKQIISQKLQSESE